MGQVLKRDEYKTEIINGIKIVMMAPPFSNHNAVKGNIHYLFKHYLRGNVCLPIPDGEKLVLEKDQYVVPDFFVICDRSKYKKDGVYGAPDLVVEVLSPKTQKIDRGDKKDLYQLHGVKEYWIVDPDNRSIEVYIPRDRVYKLNAVYRIPGGDEPPEDKENEADEFAVCLFPDMIVKLEDVFENVLL